MGRNDKVTVEEYEVEELGIDLEYVFRSDWDGMRDPCPECGGTEFGHLQYSGGHYGQYQDAVIERTDYWYQKGGLYTECKECDEVLYKHPAYDLIEDWIDQLET